MTTHSHLKLEPCLERLGIKPEALDKSSYIKEVYAIDDIDTLRQLLIDKERERQSVENDLDVAARLGLVISQTNEAIQVKLSHLEQENHELQNALTSAHETQTHHHLTYDLHRNNNGTFKYIDFAGDERTQLTKELNQARCELDKFRNEMDGLAGQLNDMASEMVDSRSKVSLYAKRLAEVEHNLALTREKNADLQLLLEKTLTSQKQSSSTTSHLVKNIQSDLIRVVNENDQLRTRIAELEHQQVECEERLSTMVTQAQEYASLLEQAQNTIHMLGEPRLDDDDFLSNDLSNISVSSSTLDGNNGYKESEVTKGAVFSVEFRQEMQKEIERNLSLRNEIRHRIITADNSHVTTDKHRTVQQGLKSLLAERDQGLLAASSSTSTITSSSSMSSSTTANASTSFRSKDENVSLRSLSRASNESPLSPSISSSSLSAISPTALRPLSPASPMNSLRPSNFLTGFNGFNNDHSNSSMGLNGINTKSFMTRGNGRFSTSSASIIHQHSRKNEHLNEAPSISTRFFQRLASRFDGQENNP